MRRLIATIGLVLIPMQASAEALSPWVQAVLDRADAGIQMADGLPEPEGALCSQETQKGLAKDTQQFTRDFIDVRQELSRRGEYLRDWTVCYLSDVHLLELKLDELRDEMVKAAEACRGPKHAMLKENFKFVAGAYEAFLTGGLLPAFRDTRLTKNYWFHDLQLHDQGIESKEQEDSTEPICPFTTDYAPHSIADELVAAGSFQEESGRGDANAKSYGCDISVIQSLPDNEEAPALADFTSKTEAFAKKLADSVSQFLWNLENAIAGIRHQPPPANEIDPTLPPPPHGKIDGCLRPLGLSPSGGSASAFDALISDYPEYFVTPAPESDEVLPGGLLAQPSYDSFSIYPDAVSMSERFVRKRGVQGRSRPLPDRFISTFSDFFMTLMFLREAPNDYRYISENTDREGGILEAIGRDPYLRMANAFSPLRSAVNDLAKATSQTVPRYITDLGYFLRRQCVDGYCQQTLENVIRRSLNPSCHPYVSGLFAQGSASDACFCISTPERPIPPDDPYCATSFDPGEYEDRGKEFFEGCTITDSASPGNNVGFGPNP